MGALKQKYHQLLLKYHPDKGLGDVRILDVITRSYPKLVQSWSFLQSVGNLSGLKKWAQNTAPVAPVGEFPLPTDDIQKKHVVKLLNNMIKQGHAYNKLARMMYIRLADASLPDKNARLRFLTEHGVIPMPGGNVELAYTVEEMQEKSKQIAVQRSVIDAKRALARMIGSELFETDIPYGLRARSKQAKQAIRTIDKVTVKDMAELKKEIPRMDFLLVCRAKKRYHYEQEEIVQERLRKRKARNTKRFRLMRNKRLKKTHLKVLAKRDVKYQVATSGERIVMAVRNYTAVKIEEKLQTPDGRHLLLIAGNADPAVQKRIQQAETSMRIRGVPGYEMLTFGTPAVVVPVGEHEDQPQLNGANGAARGKDFVSHQELLLFMQSHGVHQVLLGKNRCTIQATQVEDEEAMIVSADVLFPAGTILCYISRDRARTHVCVSRGDRIDTNGGVAGIAEQAMGQSAVRRSNPHRPRFLIALPPRQLTPVVSTQLNGANGEHTGKDDTSHPDLELFPSMALAVPRAYAIMQELGVTSARLQLRYCVDHDEHSFWLEMSHAPVTTVLVSDHLFEAALRLHEVFGYDETEVTVGDCFQEEAVFTVGMSLGENWDVHILPDGETSDDEVESQLNGSNGEWTGKDGVAKKRSKLGVVEEDPLAPSVGRAKPILKEKHSLPKLDKTNDDASPIGPQEKDERDQKARKPIDITAPEVDLTDKTKRLEVQTMVYSWAEDDSGHIVPMMSLPHDVQAYADDVVFPSESLINWRQLLWLLWLTVPLAFMSMALACIGDPYGTTMLFFDFAMITILNVVQFKGWWWWSLLLLILWMAGAVLPMARTVLFVAVFVSLLIAYVRVALLLYIGHRKQLLKILAAFRRRRAMVGVNIYKTEISVVWQIAEEDKRAYTENRDPVLARACYSSIAQTILRSHSMTSLLFDVVVEMFTGKARDFSDYEEVLIDKRLSQRIELHSLLANAKGPMNHSPQAVASAIEATKLMVSFDKSVNLCVEDRIMRHMVATAATAYVSHAASWSAPLNGQIN